MIACKVAEIVVLGLGITAILLGNVYLMFVVLFLLGGQAAIFITSKLGAIPELVRGDKIASANGVINMASMAAIIIGTFAGGVLYDHTGPLGVEQLVDFGRRRCWAWPSCGLITSFHRPLAQCKPRPADSLEPRRADGRAT